MLIGIIMQIINSILILNSSKIVVKKGKDLNYYRIIINLAINTNLKILIVAKRSSLEEVESFILWPLRLDMKIMFT